MAKFETRSKKEKEKQRLQKRQAKDQRREERKAEKPKSFEEMLAYTDEYGNITSTPPDPSKKRVIHENDIDLTSRNKGGATRAERRMGVVNHFDVSKGYGFIKDDRYGEELFFHFKAANFSIAQNDRVTFDTEMGPKGLNAVRISKA